MDAAEVEENLFAISDAKLHSGMCRQLSTIVFKILAIFPVLEGARPRSKSGIQALCSLHVALDKSKNLLQHCSECSKLYLAITGDSMLMKFEKVRCALQESLMNVYDIVPQAIGCQIKEIAGELERSVFALDEAEKQVGEEVISLLREKKNSSDSSAELQVFQQAVLRLGITSSRAALWERRALKKLMERARAEEDPRKESIVTYLLQLTRKHSSLFRSGKIMPEESDPQELSPPPDNAIRQRPLPEEFRCPISLQLMSDPVIISSGQTYERACIEKWFREGHDTCPKTQQKLAHLGLTPNFCVKGLISSWCLQNGIELTSAGKECEEEEEEEEVERPAERLLQMLGDAKSSINRYKAAEEIRLLLKDDGEARIYMGADRFVQALLHFLKSAADNRDHKAQEIGALALFNLAVNNDKNKDAILSAGVLPLLKEMISNPATCEPATALYFNLSLLERAKPIIASSEAVPILIELLSPESSSSASAKQDALFCLFNLSSHPPSIILLVEAGIVAALRSLLSDASSSPSWSEKALAILSSIAPWPDAADEIVSTPGLIGSIAAALSTAQPAAQELAISALLIVCSKDQRSCSTVLQEGVIPTLVGVSANGTQRGQEKAQKLLKLFRDQRQREQPSPSGEPAPASRKPQQPKQLVKSKSARVALRLNSFWKQRNCW